MPNPILADLEALWPGLTDQEREALLKAAQRFVREKAERLRSLAAESHVQPKERA